MVNPAKILKSLRILFRPEIAGIFIGATALCYFIGEQYPFSDFPMYSKFSDGTYLVYVTDENDDPIPVLEEFGVRTSILKKVFNGEIKPLSKQLDKRIRELTPEEMREAGLYTLDKMKTYHPHLDDWEEKYQALKIYKQEIRMTEEGLQRNAQFIAEVPVQ